LQEIEMRRESVRTGQPFRPPPLRTPSQSALRAQAAPPRRKLYLPKSRAGLERLDEELAAFEAKTAAEQGFAANFRQQARVLSHSSNLSHSR
jgi:hypothetical protein